MAVHTYRAKPYTCSSMKFLPTLVIAAISLVGCSSEPKTAENTTASGVTTSQNGLPADVKVASDGVVRNGQGEAYCVVFKKTIAKDKEAEMPRATKDGVTYIFCCNTCPGMFDKEPAKYVVAKN